MARKPFRREDWLNLALQGLATKGADALRLKDLCLAADRTIGSFYHHFADQDAFFDALMLHWRKINTVDVLAAIAALPKEKLETERLSVIAATMDQAVDIGIRNFAHHNTRAAKIVSDVDMERIAFLAQLYEKRFQMPSEQARRLAELEYAAFVGTQVIWKNGDLAHGQSLSDLFDQMVRSFTAR